MRDRRIDRDDVPLVRGGCGRRNSELLDSALVALICGVVGIAIIAIWCATH